MTRAWKLVAERLSGRSTRIPEEAFTRYYESLQARADRYLAAMPQITPATAHVEFEASTGRSPEEWLAAWKRDEVEETVASRRILVRAAVDHSAVLAEFQADEITGRRAAPARSRCTASQTDPSAGSARPCASARGRRVSSPKQSRETQHWRSQSDRRGRIQGP